MHLTTDQEVAGSNPAGFTLKASHLGWLSFFVVTPWVTYYILNYHLIMSVNTGNHNTIQQDPPNFASTSCILMNLIPFDMITDLYSQNKLNLASFTPTPLCMLY